MMNKNSIQVTYSAERLRTLVEEYITMQKHEFTFSGLCSYVLYWAKEEGKTANTGLYESNQLDAADCERISVILRKIIREGRLTSNAASFADETQLVKVKE
jgi:hypothetical protein